MGIKLAFHNTVYKKFFEQMSQHKHLKMAFRPITDHQTPRKASIADSCHIQGNHTKYISFTTLIVIPICLSFNDLYPPFSGGSGYARLVTLMII